MTRIEEIIEHADSKFKSVKRLIKKLDEVDITGFHGLFVDLIDVHENFEFLVDTALKNKLFVFVVDTVAAAEKIMKLNNEIKGGVISWFPLELIDSVNAEVPEIPNSKDIKPILEFVKLKDGVDPRVQKLLNSFIGKTVMVKKITQAFGVSEKYNVTSITADMKVVNPGSYIAKTGYWDMMKKRITPYKELVELKSKDESLKKAIFEFETTIQNFQNNDFKILKEIQEFKILERKVLQEIQRLNLDMMEKNARLSEWQQNLEKSDSTILALTKQIEVLKNAKDSLDKDMKGGKDSGKDLVDSSGLIQSLNEKKNEVIKLRLRINKLQNELDEKRQYLNNTLALREHQLGEIIEEKENAGSNSSQGKSKSKRSSTGVRNLISFSQEMVREKEKELEKITSLIEKLETQLESTQKEEIESAAKRGDIDDAIMETVVELEKLNIDRRNLHDRLALDKLEELKSKSDPVILEKDLSIAKIEEMIKKKFSEIKDIEKNGNQSHMYGFFLRMKEQFEEVKNKINKIDVAKQKIFEILDESEKSKNVAIQHSLKKLAKKFNEYFSYFVKDAETSIKFIKTLVEVKEEVKDEIINDENQVQQTNDSEKKALVLGDHQYTGISVKVGFKDKNRMQSLKELSGGEKAVVALSLLFALNSLTSSQIYLLDEIDSSLDQIYKAGLTELLSKLSNETSIQFFITTFNQELIESVIDIYQVEFKNLQSKIAPCKNTRAMDLLLKLKEDQKKEPAEQ